MKSPRSSQAIMYDNEDIGDLEQILQSSLNAIEPRSAFRNDLRSRLNQTPVLRYTPMVVFEYLLISLGGVLAAVLIILATARMINALLMSLGLLRQMRKT